VIRGTEAWKNFVREFHQAFPDFHDTIEDQVAEGDKVVTRFTSQGTQAGEFMGVPPTGKHGRWTGIVIHRIADDKMCQAAHTGYNA
jgi:predicted ester cyclase